MATLEEYSLRSYSKRNKMQSGKVILTDADGVLLDWEYAFHSWMKEKGYKPIRGFKKLYHISVRFDLKKNEGRKLVNQFNESAAIGHLSSLRDSIKYVRKLHEEHGYVFHVITSLTKERFAVRARRKNLYNLFGNTAIERLVSLESGGDKDEVLAEYKDSGCWWIEDKPANADLGLELGLKSILVEHTHNKAYDGNAIVVKKWKEIYNLVTAV
jgi:FMN phosphatase YigB (HAD superfamily)